MVTCEQCRGERRAPPELGLCERCRRLNALDVRGLYQAACALAWLDLEHLGRAQVTYPHRVPLTSVEAARLARAAQPLRAAVLGLAERPELRDAPRVGPKRAEYSPAAKRRRRGA